MNRRMERLVANSSFGTKKATEARATVSTARASTVVKRAAQIRAEKGSTNRDTK